MGPGAALATSLHCLPEKNQASFIDGHKIFQQRSLPMSVSKFSTVILTLLISGTAAAKPVKFVAQDSPPFNFLEGKTVKGASYEIMKKVCDKLKWTCEFEIVPQKRGLAMAEAGEVDGVWGIIQIAEREGYLTHSTPTWTSKPSFTKRTSLMTC